MKETLAAFDFDGTVTYRDTLISFLWYVAGPFKASWYLLLELPKVLGFLIGIVSRQTAKEAVLKRFFAGQSLADIKEQGKAFAKGHLHRCVRPEALERIAWHRSQGHRCVLVSASLDVYLKPWAEAHGFSDAVCSRFDVDSDGTVSGALLGTNCWGPEKVRRLQEILGALDSYQLYAYGDSRGDQEMLAQAQHAFYRTMPTEGAL